MARGSTLKKNKKNLAIFHCETSKAQYVQQSSPFKSSLCVRDKHAAAFRDDSEMYYALNKREKRLAGVDVHRFTRSVTDFPSCSTYCRNITFSRQVWTKRETLLEETMRCVWNRKERVGGHLQLSCEEWKPTMMWTCYTVWQPPLISIARLIFTPCYVGGGFYNKKKNYWGKYNRWSSSSLWVIPVRNIIQSLI